MSNWGILKNSLDRGIKGEAAAASFLRANGYKLVEKNYRWGGGEIDIIARDGETLVFIEVKLRTSHAYGLPEETLIPSKRAKLLRTAQRYLLEHPTNLDLRFDVVAISKGKARLIKNAFSLEE